MNGVSCASGSCLIQDFVLAVVVVLLVALLLEIVLAVVLVLFLE